MIDIGLSKLALIGVVALVVIGPERLPKMARMAGSLFGRAQRYINDVKAEVSREMELDELRKMKQDVQDAASNVENSIAGGIADTEQASHTAWNGEPDSYSSLPPDTLQGQIKAKNFRRKKLARNSALPGWYKNQSGYKTRVTSAAARVARHRPAGKTSASFYA
ncbi:Sec-independent protein translocase protein TatB [Herbaspirillum sp. RTI4]|uniref:Sec-independent protein translocase protein TatB n=1 Tax=Herbaspirillum sp. RTI4 TaxID=3048640 RepID=UPI002AB388E6|nr:Sec-independent protein translocase protein TatB [Herbaspirillum sp. RTI4]MDY7577758.1 Sec-independent protein translocase protein TatB [Herbaspirillum sp. RTI4]MEA9980814.1 Sec-independent protein translocase protein TatB [Herbaspirillum sp. RTI4]